MYLSLVVRRSALCFFLLSHDVLAQEAGAFHERWRWVHFTAADGLPAERITHLVDAGDIPWAGGDGCLAWYDGWRWRAVSPPGGFPREPLRALTTGPAGLVYTVFPSGLFAGGADGFERIALSFLTPDRQIASAALLGTGELLVLSMVNDDSGPRAELHRWGPDGAQRIDCELGEVWMWGPSLLGAPSGRVWLNHAHGISLWTGQGWKPFGSSPDRPVDVLAENASGAGLFGSRYPSDIRGLWTWGETSEAPRRTESEGHGIVLVAAVGPEAEALVVYDTSTARFRERDRWSSIEPLPEALVQPRLLRFRANGDLWTANERGLWLLRRRSQRWLRVTHGGLNDPRDRLHSMVFAGDGSLWIGSAGGVERRAPDGTPLPCQPLPEPGEVTGLALDRRGDLWASGGGTFTGLRRWDGRSWTRVTEDAQGRALGLIHALRPDRSGKLWLLGLASSLEKPREEDGALHVLEGDRAVPWEPGRELARRRFYDFAEGQDGSLWFATSKGVSRFRSGSWRHWTEADGLRSPLAFRVLSTEEGGAWVGQSQAGLARIDPGGGLHYVDLGIPASRKCLDLALGEHDDLWVSTGSGLFLVKDGIVSSFGYGAGLESLQAWPLLARGEKVYVGTLGGGLRVLDRAEAADPPPLVVLERSTHRSDRIHERWSVHPWWGELPAEEIETRYRVDGGPWSAYSSARELVLEDPEPGTRRIEVQAKGLFGTLSTPVGESVVTGRPLWERRPFWIAFGLLASGCLALAVVQALRRRRDAAALERREMDYRSLMEGASDAIFWCDRDGVCRGANPSACALLGRERADLIGAPLESFLVPEPGSPGLFTRLDDPEGAVLAVRALRPGRDALHAEASVKLVDGERVLAIVRDLTERMALEEERRSLEHALVHGQRLESLGLLAGGVAHEFNNLLMLVMGHADQALDRLRDDRELRADLSKVIQAARRAGELTQKLLAFAGADSIEPRPCDPNALAGELEDLLRSSVHPSIRFRLELAPALPGVEGDPVRLRQALLSLVLNASEAIGEEGGEIVLATRLVEESERGELRLELDHLSGAGALVAIAVRDTGRGMDERTRARAFEPFFTTKPRARGLGLAAVAGIVRAHRGAIAVESRPGGGSAFAILLPVARAPLPRHPEGSSPLACPDLVLLIDDDDAVREVTAAMLRRAGFRALTAAGGPEGVALFREHAPELLCAIVDLTMPGMSGLETRAALLAIRPDAPVLLTSGYNEQILREQEWLIPQAFLRKPFTAEELEARLRGLPREARSPSVP